MCEQQDSLYDVELSQVYNVLSLYLLYTDYSCILNLFSVSLFDIQLNTCNSNDFI